MGRTSSGASKNMTAEQYMREVDGGPRPALKVRIPPNARFGHSVRQEVITFANSCSVDRHDLDEFIFAVGEALANAIEHSGSNDVIEIRCQVENDRILATVIDSGAGFDVNPDPKTALPDDLNEHGRGLPIMRRCTDIFAVHSVPGKGTAVVLGRYLRRTAPQFEEKSKVS
ncbi:MAG: ATP-binding protein [Candidatus Eremiobacteraeota bacterium]|nr:ATP-binding protein [Candidatus Eremiobacteraeota bacterium]